MKIDKETIKTIENNPIAIATATRDGTPNAAVVAYVKVKNNKLIITNNYMEKTVDNIKQNQNISIVVWNKDWRGYKIQGTAEYTEKGAQFEFVKSMKENKEEPCKGAIIVAIKSIKKIG